MAVLHADVHSAVGTNPLKVLYRAKEKSTDVWVVTLQAERTNAPAYILQVGVAEYYTGGNIHSDDRNRVDPPGGTKTTQLNKQITLTKNEVITLQTANPGVLKYLIKIAD
jgi:hypothetical protein